MTLAHDTTAVHDVIFSESDAELVSVAGERLAGALDAGSAVIVIATARHRHEFTEAIRARGVDPDVAVADGSMLLLDAAETLDRLIRDGSFDRSAFLEVIGTLVREAAADRTVEAFGEMVGVLWAAGRYEEAVDLEAAWDELIEQTSISLLCAYPATLFEEAAGAAGLASICGLHSAVVAEATYERTWHFQAHRRAAGEARRAVANALRSRGVGEDTFYDAQSVVTELVANALIHTGSPFSVEVGVDATHVRVRVGDDSTAGELRVKAPNPRRPSGSGLRLVDELADRWGIDRHQDGKSVWAELQR